MLMCAPPPPLSPARGSTGSSSIERQLAIEILMLRGACPQPLHNVLEGSWEAASCCPLEAPENWRGLLEQEKPLPFLHNAAYVQRWRGQVLQSLASRKRFCQDRTLHGTFLLLCSPTSGNLGHAKGMGTAQKGDNSQGYRRQAGA